MQRCAVAQPNVWEAGAWPRRGHITCIVRVGTIARFLPNNRRVHVAVARLNSRNLRYFTLLDIEDRADLGPRGRAFWRVVSNVGMIGRAPAEPSGHRGAGCLHVAHADRPALSTIGSEQLRAAPSAQRRRELPGEIGGIAYAGVHSEAACGDYQVCCVPRDENATFRVTL